MGSLRVRVTLLVASILIVTLGAVGLVFVLATRVEVNRFLVHEEEAPDLSSLELIRSRIEREGLDNLLEWSRMTGIDETTRFLVVAGNRVRSTNAPGFAGGQVTEMPGGGFRIEAEGLMIMLKVEPIAARTPSGEYVHLIAIPNTSDRPRGEELIQPLQRWIALLVASGALVGIVLLIAVVRRVTGPLESLTDAVNRMTEGDLSVRVDARGHDEVAQLAGAFNSLAERLEHVEESRRNMVSDVAHELRAPLTNIRCELESVQDGVRPLVPDRIDSIHSEILALGSLVDDLQDLALADAGQLNLDPAPIDLLALLRVTARRFEATAAAREVSIRLTGESVIVEADERRTGQVAGNLVTNAITHSPEGGCVEIRLSSGRDVARVEIVDEGDGVDPEDTGRIFERFYRPDQSRARATGGSGLGLAIARAIIEAHGGTIGVENAVEGGAKFWFELKRGG